MSSLDVNDILFAMAEMHGQRNKLVAALREIASQHERAPPSYGGAGDHNYMLRAIADEIERTQS